MVLVLAREQRHYTSYAMKRIIDAGLETDMCVQRFLPRMPMAPAVSCLPGLKILHHIAPRMQDCA